MRNSNRAVAARSALVAVLLAAAAVAGNVHFSGSVSFSLGSLIASGDLAGLGRTDVNVVLTASGTPEVTCTNRGGNPAPGRNPASVTAGGSYLISQTLIQNGRAPFRVETTTPGVSPSQAGCPNGNWSAAVTFVYWTRATITVQDQGGAVLLRQDYACNTTRSSVFCTPL